MHKNILLDFAFVLFIIGTFYGPYPSPVYPEGTPWYSRFGLNVVSLGLALWVASLIFG
jgi:hypothetical protein